MGRLYLDNAATSWPKPPGVGEAMAAYVREIGASAGRGRYAEADRGAGILHSARRRCADLFGVPSPELVVFALNCTDALNLAIKGRVLAWRRDHPGRRPHVVTTELDHNSVLRQLRALERDGVDWTCLPVDHHTWTLDPARVRDALTDDTALVAMTHASNVTGTIQPATDVAQVCRSRGVPFLLDAAQSAGHIPVDLSAMGADMVAFPGHKGLLGPLGTGGLALAPGADRLIETVREGGTGSWSESDAHPETLPTKFEAGSHNAPGIAGLDVAVEWIQDRTVSAIRAHEVEVLGLLLEGLARGTGVRLLGSPDPSARVGVVTITCGSGSPGEIAHAMEHHHGVLVRSGIHCAPRAHQALGTSERGGGVRLSLGPFVTASDVHRASHALLEAIGPRVVVSSPLSASPRTASRP